MKTPFIQLPVIMCNHNVLKEYNALPPGTRLATDQDFFKPGEVLRLEMPYFWQRVMDDVYNASRVKANTYDADLRMAIKGKRVWVLKKAK